MRSRLRFALGLSLFLLTARDGSAHPGITGYSGKPYNGVSETCTTNCHAKGGTAPTLTITAPTSVAAGSTNVVTLVVAGNKVRTSMNVAFSDGTKTIKGTNTDTPLPVQEPTEVGAAVPPPSGATGTYTFSFIAPKTSGTITMWVAGMAASGAGTGGDGVANTTRTITVTAASVDGGAGDGGIDAGSSGGSSGTSSGGPADAGTNGSSGGGGESSGSSGAATSNDPPADSGGCSLTRRPSKGATSVFASVALGLAVVLARRGRRRS